MNMQSFLFFFFLFCAKKLIHPKVLRLCYEYGHVLSVKSKHVRCGAIINPFGIFEVLMMGSMYNID